MTLISVSQDIPIYQYNLILYFGASFSIVFFIYLIFHCKYPLKKSAIYTITFFIASYYFAYTYIDKFYSAKVSGNYLALSYMAPSHDKTILINDIKSITFGSANRSGTSCYISIKLNSGKSYKSTAIPEKVIFCKNTQKELLKTLKIDKIINY